MWGNADYGPFDQKKTDKKKIDAGIAVPCRICLDIFGRLRITSRYCMKCKKGFCEGEHGNFPLGGKVGKCVRCNPPA
jgi:hypothetical protein